jgi:hypothetical protein
MGTQNAANIYNASRGKTKLGGKAPAEAGDLFRPHSVSEFIQHPKASDSLTSGSSPCFLEPFAISNAASALSLHFFY